MVSEATESQLKVFLGLVWPIPDSISMVRWLGGHLNPTVPWECVLGCTTQKTGGPEALIYSLSFSALPQPPEAITGASKVTRGLQLRIGRDWGHEHYVLKPLLFLYTP